MTQTTTHLNACDASIWLDDDADTLTDISGSSNSVDLYFTREIREFRIADSGSYPYRCGQWADGEIVLRAVYSTATDEAIDLLNAWFHASGVLSARSMNVAVVGSAGTDYYYGEVVLESLRIPTDSQEPGPIPVEARLLTKGAWATGEAMWYVDSVNGSDANSGRSPTEAFETLSAAESAVGSGESVGMARGSDWREEFVCPDSDISILAYGEGDDPIIRAFDIQTNGDWAKTGGRVNVYEKTIAIPADGQNTAMTLEDDVRLERVADVATCDATQGSHYVANETTASMTVYVHASDSSDVTTNGKVYECAVRASCISGGGNSGISVTGIYTIGCLLNDGSIQMGGGDCTLTDCTMKHGSSHNCVIAPPCTVDGCLFLDGYAEDLASAILLTLYGAAPAGTEDSTIVDCTFRRSDYNLVGGSVVSGISAHSGAGDFDSVLVDSCTFENFATRAISGLNDHATVTIQDCTFTDCRYGLGVPAEVPPGGCTFLVDGGTWDSDIASQRLFNPASAPAGLTVEITGMTAEFRNTAANGYIYIASAQDLYIHECTFNNHHDASIRRCIFCSNAGADLTLNENVYGGTENWSQIYYFSAIPTWTSDWNTFGPNLIMYLNPTTYNNLLDYQNGTGEDLHSTGP